MNPCGCKIDIYFSMDKNGYEYGPSKERIKYCPLHQAAGEMLVYTKSYHEELKKYKHTDSPKCCKVSRLIAKAEGRTDGKK